MQLVAVEGSEPESAGQATDRNAVRSVRDSPVMQIDFMRRGVAEFIGTFALIFVGAGSALYANIVGSSAFANGLVIAIMVSAFAGISGGHFNPAVTLGFLVTRRIAPVMGVFYWVVQLAGAAPRAGLAVKCILGTIGSVSGQESVNGLHLGAPSIQGGITSGQGVMIEAILTFFLVLVVFATAVDLEGRVRQDRRSRNRAHDRLRRWPHGRRASPVRRAQPARAPSGRSSQPTTGRMPGSGGRRPARRRRVGGDPLRTARIRDPRHTDDSDNIEADEPADGDSGQRSVPPGTTPATDAAA